MKVGAEVSKRFLTNVLGTLAGFLGTIYFTQVLGAAGIGVLAIFQSLQMITANVVSVGLYTSVIKRVSEGENQARHFASGAVIVLAGFAVSLVAYALARPLVNDVLTVEAALLVPFGVLSWSAFRLTGSYLEGEGRVALAGLIENSRYVVIVGIQTALVLANFGVYGLLWGLVAGQFVTFGIAYGFARVVPARPSPELFREFVSFTGYAYVQSLASQVFKQADYIILGQLLGTSAAGVYRISFTMAEASMLFTAALSRVSFPEISRLSKSERRNRVSELFARVFTYAGLFAIPAFGGGAIVGNALLLTIYQVNAGTAQLPLVGTVGFGNALIAMLALANLCNGYRDTLEGYFFGLDRPRVAALSGVVLIVVYAVLVVPLTVAFDAIGLAAATTVSFAASVAFLLWNVDLYPPRSTFLDVGLQVAAMAVMVAGVLGVRELLGDATGIVHLTVVLVSGAAIYFGALLALSGRIRNDAYWVGRDLWESLT
jgi:O-antigen/teichoic acid export membrane protein